VLVGLFAAYALAYILTLSVVVGDDRYFLIADDQFVSMRYAENLANGRGLVWNAGGDRVEGFTNPLWVAYMAFFHWLGMGRPVVGLAIQVSGAVFFVVALVFIRAIARKLSARPSPAGLCAVALAAFYVPVVNWVLQGTEVSLLICLYCAVTWLLIRDATERRQSPLAPFVLMGISTLVRPDAVVFAIAILSAFLIDGSLSRRTLLTGASMVVGTVVMATLLRLWYFGYPLPNTFYLKMTGYPLLPRLTRGLYVAVPFAFHLAPLIALLVLRGTLRAAGHPRALLWIFGGHVAYSIYVGGDAWEWMGGSNRFIAVAMPLFLALAGITLAEFRIPTTSARPANRVPELLGPWTLAVATALLIVATNTLALAAPPDGINPFKRMLLVAPPLGTEENERNLRAALEIRTITDERAVVAVTWAGAIPYFSERTAIDLLGKNDTRIAHEPMRLPDSHLWTGFAPGHMKWNYRLSIGELRPDVVQGPLMRLEHVAAEPTPYLVTDYEKVQMEWLWYLRRDSPFIRWERIRSDP
jgi:hypothetical protein